MFQNLKWCVTRMYQQSKVLLYRWGVRARGKTSKHGKVCVKRKRWVLAQLPYSPQGNGSESPKVEPGG